MRNFAVVGLGLGLCAPGGAPRNGRTTEAIFEVIAHRGASADAPENTLAAFRMAREQGALHIELDVRQSRDGEVVVFHDRDLEEKTSGVGAVAETDFAQLATLDLASWFRRTRGDGPPVSAADTGVVSLSQVFEALGAGPIYHIEIKSEDPAFPGRVLRVVEAAQLHSRVRITSFHLASLRRIRAGSTLPLCWLLPRLDEAHYAEGRAATPAALRRRAVDRARDEDIERIALPAAEVDRELVAYARERGIDVRVWRVPTLEAMESAVEAGASGATVDWPGRAFTRLRERGTPAE